MDARQLPGRQGRLLFAYLVTKNGRPVARDELAEVLWEGAAPPATWDKALRVLVSKLRKVLTQGLDENPTTVTAAFGCYQLDLPAGSSVDIVTAEDAAKEAEDALAGDELQAAIAAATLAESLLRQPFMPGDDGDWVQGKRRELADVRLRALDTLAESSLRSGEPENGVRWAEQAVEFEPFRESGYRRLMAAHIAAGNRAEALRVYDRCRRLLADELGAYPSPETEASYRHLLDAPTNGSVTETTAERPPTDLPRKTSTRGHGRRTMRSRWKLAVLTATALITAAAATSAFVGRGGAAPTVVPNSVIRIDPQTLKVTQVIPVGDAPDLVIASAGYLWITNHIQREGGSGEPRNGGDRTLTRVDPVTGKAMVVGGGLAPCGMTPDPSGDVWVANCYPPNIPGLRDDVVRVDASTLAFKKTLAAPGGDGFFRGLAYGGGFLWVSQIVGTDVQNANAVTRIDPTTNRRRTIRVTRAASDLAWSGGYGDLWIDNFNDAALSRMLPGSGTVETVRDVGILPGTPVVDGNTVWVGDWASPLLVRIRATGSPRVRRIALPGGTAGVWNVALGAGAVWATTPHDGALWRVDAKTNHVKRVTVPHLPTGVAADANDVWVTVRGR